MTWRRARRQRGQTLVEFALIVPIFALLLFALLDFGRVVYVQNTITQAAREAIRVAMLEPSDSSAKYSAIRAAALNAAPGVGLTSADVDGAGCTDCFYPNGTEPGSLVVVRVSNSVSLMTPLLAQVLGGTFTLQSTSRGFIP